MAFKKGISGNPTGRPKGANNKATSDLRTWINQFIDENREQIKDDWKKLDAKDRLLMFEKLLKYSIPALQATSLDLNFEKLTDEQLDEIINRLTEANEEH
ncbi:MAG: DUF5681 domain-containing protein [Ginsengibacter sp.]